MEQDSIYVSKEHNQENKPGQKIAEKGEEIRNDEPVRVPSENRLWIATLVLVFIAFNIWGYYFYIKGFFGISADIATVSTPAPSSIEKSDSIYMIPGV